MTTPTPSALLAALRETVIPLSGTQDDFRLVMDRVGSAPLVLQRARSDRAISSDSRA